MAEPIKGSTLPIRAFTVGDALLGLDEGGTTARFLPEEVAGFVADQMGVIPPNVPDGSSGFVASIGTVDIPITDGSTARPDYPGVLIWITSGGPVLINKAPQDLQVSVDEVNPLTDINWYTGFSASDPAWTPPSDGGAVSSWPAGDGSGFSLTQATGGNQPLYRASVAALGNRPAIDFDGVSDYLEKTSGVSLAQPYSIVAVIAPDVADANALFVGTHTGGSNRGAGTVDTGSGRWVMNAGTQDGTNVNTVANGVGYLVVAYFNGSSSRMLVNGVEQPSLSAVGAASLNQLIVGAGRASSGPSYGSYFNGQIGELYAVSGDVTVDPNWANVSAYLGGYYSLPLA